MKTEIVKSFVLFIAVVSASFGHSQARRGTSDTGGGNGLFGKMFESYIVDPTKLPSFKLVEKMFGNIQLEDENSSSYLEMAKAKPWYIAYVDFTKISKDTLGVAFFETETDQLALQTKYETWIRKQNFDVMSLEEQADTIAHEIVVGFYFLKFMNFEDMCKMRMMVGDEKSAESCSPNAVRMMDKLLPPEPLRKFVDQDYVNIRAITNWLKKNAESKKPVSEKFFKKLLVSHGFDKRLFGVSASKDEAISMKGEDLYQAIEAADLSGHVLNHCFFENKKTNRPCKIETKRNSFNFYGQSYPSLSVHLDLAEEGRIEFEGVIGDSNLFPATHNGDVFYVGVMPEVKNQFKRGDRNYTAIFIFEKNDGFGQFSLKLKSILIKPSVIVSINKSRKPVCQLLDPKVNKLIDDRILVREGDREDNSYAKLAGEFFIASWVTTNTCSEDNVKE